MNIEEAKQLDIGDMVVYYDEREIITFIINGKESFRDYGLITIKKNDELYIEWMSEDETSWHLTNDDGWQNFWQHVEKVQ
jgi:hypothetical protein